MEEPRRSARANKGVHSGRDLLDLYYENAIEPASKRMKLESDEEQIAVYEVPETQEIVRCLPCKTNDSNYDEETDEGGTMIECERCTTWQHAKCMGFKTEKQIPDKYICDVCTARERFQNASKRDNSASDEPYSDKKSASSQNTGVAKTQKTNKANAIAAKKAAILAAVQKSRDSVTKALTNVITKTKSDLDDVQTWASKVEGAIFEWARGTDKKYIEKSRAIMALLKKAVVLDRLIKSEISPSDLATLPVEEIDPDLKHYAEKVRQESIRRSVLVVEDDQSQRVRRTHKGEEIVESVQDEGVEQNINITPRNLSRENTNELQQSSRKPIYSNPSTNNVYQLEDDDDYATSETGKITTGEEKKTTTLSKNGNDSDDDMDFILERKSKSPEPRKPSKPKSAKQVRLPPPKLPPTTDVMFWTGRVELPDVVTASAQAEFVSCTNYKQPTSVSTIKLHNKAMRVCNELLADSKIQIQGRLDRSRADPYIEKIKTSRDLYLVKLVDYKTDANFNKLLKYFKTRGKVGVVSSRSNFVKDAYLYAVDEEVSAFADMTANFESGLYIVFVVKKDYTPVGKSILKNSAPTPNVNQDKLSLHSILSRLEGSNQHSQGEFSPQHNLGNMHSRNNVNFEQMPIPQQHQMPISHQMSIPQQHPIPVNHFASAKQNDQQTSSGLTQEQLFFLTDLVKKSSQNQSSSQGALNMMQNHQG